MRRRLDRRSGDSPTRWDRGCTRSSLNRRRSGVTRMRSSSGGSECECRRVAFVDSPCGPHRRATDSSRSPRAARGESGRSARIQPGDRERAVSRCGSTRSSRPLPSKFSRTRPARHRARGDCPERAVERSPETTGATGEFAAVVMTGVDRRHGNASRCRSVPSCGLHLQGGGASRVGHRRHQRTQCGPHRACSRPCSRAPRRCSPARPCRSCSRDWSPSFRTRRRPAPDHDPRAGRPGSEPVRRPEVREPAAGSAPCVATSRRYLEPGSWN